MKGAAIISLFRQGDTRRALFIAAQIAARTFRASAAHAVQSRVLPAAERTTAVNSTPVFACGSLRL